MAFGTQQQTQTSDTGGGERWELRTLGFTESQDKKTSKGKPYWRVKDQNNKWYSVWISEVYASIEIAAGNNENIPCAVKISPGDTSPFYSIEAVNAAAEPAVAAGTAKAATSRAPGGRNSEFGKRMHPDESLRVGLMNSSSKAVDMAISTLVDRPDNVTCEQWLYAKIPEYMNFVNGLIKLPITPTPDEAPAPEAPAPSGFQHGGE